MHPNLARRMLRPTPVPGIGGARHVAVALNACQTCVHLDGERVICWNGPAHPPSVVAERGATEIAVGLAHECVRRGNASARCPL